MRKAVVLLSGGVDSTTVAAIAQADGFEVAALSFSYGQRHAVEVDAARRVAAHLGVHRHEVISLDLRAFGGSALTDDIAVPKGRDLAAMADQIPVTYVPARNTIFLSFALAFAEVLAANDIFIGVNALDYSVSGDTQVWVRAREWARLMPIRDFCALPKDDYQTIAVDPRTLELGWHRVTDRHRHFVGDKRSFTITLERGQRLTVTEDHSLFTIDEASGRLTTIRGADISVGTPIVVPFDLSGTAGPWAEDLLTLDLRGIAASRRPGVRRSSTVARDGYLTNRLGRTRVPLDFPVTDDFLYVVGLWLAEGGKDPEADSTTLAFSVGSIPGAAATLTAYLSTFGVAVSRSPANDVDHEVTSSVIVEVFRHLGLFGTSKIGNKRYPDFFWRLSQRQRRVVIAGLWDGDGGHVINGEAIIAQKSHALIDGLYHALILDGIFPAVRAARHGQKVLALGRAQDFRRFVGLYPLRHPSKRQSFEVAGELPGRDKVTGLWKCDGVWREVAAAALPAGTKTRVYNAGGKYDEGVRAQRSAFADVPSLERLVASRLAFLRVKEISETFHEDMYDLSVEDTQNFIANGVLAHNSGYPDCRPEYIRAFEAMANLATKAAVEGRQRVRIHTPLIQFTKAQIIARGLALGVDFGLTLSCYDPSPTGESCGACDACLLRLKGFAENGLRDPARYRAATEE